MNDSGCVLVHLLSFIDLKAGMNSPVLAFGARGVIGSLEDQKHHTHLVLLEVADLNTELQNSFLLRTDTSVMSLVPLRVEWWGEIWGLLGIYPVRNACRPRVGAKARGTV